MLKELIERRNTLIENLNTLKEVAKTRAVTEEENKDVEVYMREVKDLDNRIKLLEMDTREVDIVEEVKDMPVSEELRRFLINPTLTLRYGTGEGNHFKLSDVGQGGVIMPKTLSNQIIEKALEESEILPHITKYAITGELIIPKFDRSTLEVGFYDEFAEVLESNAAFTSIKIVAHRISGLVKISKSLINNVNFDIENFLITQLSTRFREFLEKSVIQGNTTKFDALFTAAVDKTITLKTKGAWSIDDLIDLQIKLPTSYQSRAKFVMHKELLSTFRKLKDTSGQYYVLPDITRGFGYTILNTPIVTTDYAPKDKVLYADLSCYTLASANELHLQALVEKYATQYAVGALADGEFGGKIVDEQGFAILKDK